MDEHERIFANGRSALQAWCRINRPVRVRGSRGAPLAGFGVPPILAPFPKRCVENALAICGERKEKA